jgi:nitrile hydratase
MSAGGAPHDHAHQRDDEDSVSYYRTMEIAVRALLIEKGVFSAEDVRIAVEEMDGRHYSRGAKVVARAWTDDAFRARLIANGAQAVRETGLDVGPLKLVVVENTPEVHNVIVCTLCSCYPRMLLGLPPDWYKSREYRSRVVREPRAVLADFGTRLPEGVAVRVHDSSADMRYMVLPMRPAGSAGESLPQLAQRVTRDALIGTTVIDR